MKAVVKFNHIRKIEDHCDGTVTIHYTNDLSVVKALKEQYGQKADKLGTIYSVRVEKGCLVNYYA